MTTISALFGPPSPLSFFFFVSLAPEALVFVDLSLLPPVDFFAPAMFLEKNIPLINDEPISRKLHY
jgi:hypothetical protein